MLSPRARRFSCHRDGDLGLSCLREHRKGEDRELPWRRDLKNSGDESGEEREGDGDLRPKYRDGDDGDGDLRPKYRDGEPTRDFAGEDLLLAGERGDCTSLERALMCFKKCCFR